VLEENPVAGPFCCPLQPSKVYISLNYTRLFLSPWNILKISKKYTTKRIVIILTPIERETLQVFDVSTSYISFDRGAARKKCDFTARVSRTGCRHTSLWQR
jgi:hypothetical protein